MKFKISVDTGGTFTDVVVQSLEGRLVIGKALTTPDRIFQGMREALVVASSDLGLSLEDLLGQSELLIYGTTRSTNAIVQGKVAKTAFLDECDRPGEGCQDCFPDDPGFPGHPGYPRRRQVRTS